MYFIGVRRAGTIERLRFKPITLHEAIDIIKRTHLLFRLYGINVYAYPKELFFKWHWKFLIIASFEEDYIELYPIIYTYYYFNVSKEELEKYYLYYVDEFMNAVDGFGYLDLTRSKAKWVLDIKKWLRQLLIKEIETDSIKDIGISTISFLFQTLNSKIYSILDSINDEVDWYVIGLEIKKAENIGNGVYLIHAYSW